MFSNKNGKGVLLSRGLPRHAKCSRLDRSLSGAPALFVHPAGLLRATRPSECSARSCGISTSILASPPLHDSIQTDVREVIDPASGFLRLTSTDVDVAGNGGPDIRNLRIDTVQLGGAHTTAWKVVRRFVHTAAGRLALLQFPLYATDLSNQ